jgi:hypothetical protein
MNTSGPKVWTMMQTFIKAQREHTRTTNITTHMSTLVLGIWEQLWLSTENILQSQPCKYTMCLEVRKNDVIFWQAHIFRDLAGTHFNFHKQPNLQAPNASPGVKQSGDNLAQHKQSFLLYLLL